MRAIGPCIPILLALTACDRSPDPVDRSRKDAAVVVVTDATERPRPTAEALAVMVRIPGGDFVAECPLEPQVSNEECARRQREKRIYVGEFFIDRTEVTVAAYRSCVDAGTCGVPKTRDSSNRVDPFCRDDYVNWGKPDRDDHPVNCVTFEDARAYCAWRHMHLPTELQWEKAARGVDGRYYPWGNEPPSCDRAVLMDGREYGCGHNTTWPVGSRPAGATPEGLVDMVGNVAEMVAGWLIPEPSYSGSKGGDFMKDVAAPWLYPWVSEPSGIAGADTGFRCAYQPSR